MPIISSISSVVVMTNTAEIAAYPDISPQYVQARSLRHRGQICIAALASARVSAATFLALPAPSSNTS